jgi:hypothetical protein
MLALVMNVGGGGGRGGVLLTFIFPIVPRQNCRYHVWRVVRRPLGKKISSGDITLINPLP